MEEFMEPQYSGADSEPDMPLSSGADSEPDMPQSSGADSEPDMPQSSGADREPDMSQSSEPDMPQSSGADNEPGMPQSSEPGTSHVEGQQPFNVSKDEDGIRPETDLNTATPPPRKRLRLREKKQSSQLDTSLSTVFSDSDYFPTPRSVPEYEEASKKGLCFLDFQQLHSFIEQINSHRSCTTPGCNGNLVAVSFKVKGYGGGARITYLCNGCEEQEFTLDTCKIDGKVSEISRALHVAFIINGCTFTTYSKVLSHSLGIQSNDFNQFQETIRVMYPVVKGMVDTMCTEAMEELKQMDQDKLGSWSRAVTTADGAWMTRGHHSKNFTFSIRDYFTGALLFRKHLCQKGSDYIIKEPLYKGTSKAAEGYATRELFEKAKEMGMKVEINWQDQDSSSSKTIKEVYPKARIMMCGGHTGRSHLKQLQTMAKKKKFSKALKDRNKKDFPEVEKKQYKCHCKKRHSPGCGCLTDAFIKQSRNNFSLILSSSQSAEEFAQRLRDLYHHATDEHEWKDGKCDFHSPTVCSCGECTDRNHHTCPGKEYHTRNKLTCPFHTLAYKMEIERRAGMADSVVHPELKRGHSNMVEASHNVLIRFRSKHISLERLHYHLSTDLGLLQANLTYMHRRDGSDSHWIPELYKRLKLPVYSGIEEALRGYGKERARKIERIKEERQKKRRIQLKIRRTQCQEDRKMWSKKHGGDTYGDSDDVTKPKAKKQHCKCGSTTHSKTSSKNCPLNKTTQSGKSNIDNEDRRRRDFSDGSSSASDDSDTDNDVTKPKAKKQHCKCGSTTHSRTTSKNCPLNKSCGQPEPTGNSSDESSSSSENESMDDEFLDLDDLDDEILLCEQEKVCTCESLKAHRIDCPMNTRNLYRKRLFSQTATFKLGDIVAVHTSVSKTTGKHLVCRIVQVNDRKYTLYCNRGTLSERFGEKQLQHCTDRGDSIPIDKWRQSEAFSLKRLDSIHFVDCCCRSADFVQPDFEYVGSDDDVQPDRQEIGKHSYVLSTTDIDTIRPGKWLNDAVIAAGQILLLQNCPHIEGLQPPTLQQVRGFQIHRGEFVQILNQNNKHWIVVSNIACSQGEVNVFDTAYEVIDNSSIPIIASLVFNELPVLKINMVDVGRQTNDSDCGVLAIAIAYDLCAGIDPSTVEYDHTAIRQHLLECLKNYSLTRFPVKRPRLSQGVTFFKDVNVYCSCRMPDMSEFIPEHVYEDGMAECDGCHEWYHQSCMDIPDKVFNKKILWKCTSCSKN